MPPGRCHCLAAVAACLALLGLAVADVSRPGGAGHALLFQDHGVLIEGFKDLAPDAFTFEAWLSTTDFCHSSAIFSYALDSRSADPRQRTADFNHFVIFDPTQVVACHDYEFIDLWPDPGGASCAAAFNHSSKLPNFVERDGRWHHLAVTWERLKDGLTQASTAPASCNACALRPSQHGCLDLLIYLDGLLVASTVTHKTRPLQPGGALMLGAEQDCYGGCTDRGQGYHGHMDEVRLWRTARSQADILAHMRDSGLTSHPDLAANWKFNDPEQNGIYRETRVAHDSSGRGNDLHLVSPPAWGSDTMEQGGKRLEAGYLSFRNNYAMNSGFAGMPDRDVTVEFWARLPAFTPRNSSPEASAELFSFATSVHDEGAQAATAFLDDGILIERYMNEYKGSHWLDFQQFSTRGAISIHINANREGNGKRFDHWVDFDAKWLDNAWHHVAVTWAWDSGEVQLYMDGLPQTPFWVSKAGETTVKDPSRGGVDSHIAARTTRSTNGSLVLGQAQNCYGGCFSPESSLHGDIAALRVWSRVLSKEEVAAGMFEAEPQKQSGLAASYAFGPETASQLSIVGKGSAGANPLHLGADAPAWVYSSAPLAQPDGTPVAPPTPGSAGHAMFLSDQQVLIVKDFKEFPADELTLEFWMMSTDTCRKGVPFSYATGGYSKSDNSFLLFDYNSWGVSVMEDEGGLRDHLSGTAATDGRWHHVAVTWRSQDGLTTLYDNGREVWSVVRGRGMTIPSGGTLVVGREQDCEGGCFDSAEGKLPSRHLLGCRPALPGAAGDVQEGWEQEYGPQDFFGLIDEMRVWRKARSQQQIQDGMRSNLFRKGMTGERFDAPGIDPKDPDLVAYWNFDEGRGWLVHDMTGRGHDLLATKNPRWEVVRWLSVCGNGLLEGLEECDDGDFEDGDGCSAACKVEFGWTCTKTSPSRCSPTGRGGGPSDDQPLDPRVDPSGGGGGGGGAQPPAPAPGGGAARTSHKGLTATVVGLALVGALVGALVAGRDRIYDHFPQAERAVHGLASLLSGHEPRHSFGTDLPYGDFDDGSPDFTQARPAPSCGAAARQQQGLGYQPLPETAPAPAPPQPQQP